MDRMTADKPGPFWKRLLWFVALWAAGVLGLAVVGYAIKLLIP